MRVTLLGTGTSQGVPMIGCDCAVCHSTDSRDRRMRPSILFDLGQHRPSAAAGWSDSATAAAVRYVLVDTGTDLRAQALAFDVRRVDAILFTHSHADHILGLDEVRRFNAVQQTAIGAYGDAKTMAELRRTFAYMFDGRPHAGARVAQLRLFSVGGAFTLGGVDIIPIPVMHGPQLILGYRVGSFAYLTDCSAIPDASWPLLDGVRTLVIDALRDRPHATHFSVSQALEVAERLAPERTYFTHICHDLKHDVTCARLPSGVQLAYDGLVLEL